MAEEPPTSEQIVNTPAATSQDTGGDRSWERAWTLDEIRKGADRWTLAGDAGLLQYLQDFSQKMISRTHEIEKEVANLIHESKLTGVRVNNAFNDFMMLANTQFVENRVYVDDEEIQEKNSTDEKKTEEQEKSREQRESELIPKVTEAIKLGVNVIEEAFEKLDTNVDNTDSEDEDESYRVDPILEAKDPYVDRLLPYLIGSPNFMNDDDVGLKDISDEESDAGSISESESEEEAEKDDKKQESEYSYSDSMSDDSETEKPKPRKKILHSDNDDEDSDSEGDLFGESKKDSDRDNETEESDVDEKEQSQDKISSQEPVDFQAELARKLGGGAPPKPPTPRMADGDEDDADDDMSKSTEKQKKKKKKEKEKKRHKTKSIERDEDDLFQPEKDNSDDDLFGGGMFAKKSGGLFDKDEESDEEDMFGDSTQKKKSSVKKVEEKEDIEAEEEDQAEVEVVADKKRGRTASGKKIPAGGVSIFGGAAIQKSGGGGGLFDDDDEDDLFNSTSKPKSDSLSEKAPEQKSVPAPKSGGSGLFADDDEDDDLFGGKPAISTNISKPATKQQDSKKLSLFDDDDDNEGADDFSSSVVKQESKPIEEKKEPPKKKLPAGAVSMFGPGGLNPLAAALKKQRPGSDEEDDDWSDGEKSRSGSLKSNQSTASKSSVQSLSSKPKSNSFSRNAKSTAGIFDEDEGDDLFGVSARPPATKQPEKKKLQEEKPRSGSLFDDDDGEEDLFGSKPAEKPKGQTKKPPAGAVSLFPGGLDPFGKKKEQEQEPEKEDKKEEPPKKAAISLFGDDETEDGLFGGGDTKPAPVKQITAGKTKSMFDDDDDDLFGSKQDDLFSKPPEPAKSLPTEPAKVEQKKVDTTTSVTKVTKPKATKPAVGTGLFGDEEEEGDLFSKPLAAKEPSDMDEQDNPKPQQKKPPVGGVSMFGPGAGALLPGLKKKQDKAENEQPDVKQDKEKEEVKSSTKKPVDPLFGDEEEEDDLFGGGPVKKQEVKPLPKKEEVKPVKPTSLITPPPLGNGILDNLDDNDDDDDLFGTGKQDDKKTDGAKQPDSLTEAKPKKPVGGVSMFGGMNPFAGRVKKQAEAEPVLGTSPDISSPEDDLFSSSNQKPKVDTKKVEPVVSKENKPPVTGKIGKLQANLNFNPAAMLPGAAPPTKEPEPINIGFDVPAEARTLQSANKDRAKIQAKRRPQSRVARKRASAQSPDRAADDFFSSPTSPLSPKSPDVGFDSSRIPPPLSDTPPRVPSPETESASPRKTDMFGNEDLFGETSPKSTTKSVIEPKSMLADTSDIFTSNAFADKKNKKQSDNLDDMFASPSVTSAVKSNVNIEQNDDLFKNVGKTFTDSKPKSKPLTNDKIDDDDDLFSSPALSKSKIKEDKKKEPEKSDEKRDEKKSKSVIAQEDDDLFSTPALTKSKDKGNKEAKGNPGVEDDIFGDSSLNKKKEEQKKTEVSAEPAENDDIFAVTKLEKKTKAKKAMTKDEDLFDDKTDIFDDIPKAKPKEKKVKKKTAAPKKQIFKDDIDDIFADTSAPSKPKEKKKEKKKTTDTAKSVTKDKGKSLDDIFDDPLS